MRGVPLRDFTMGSAKALHGNYNSAYPEGIGILTLNHRYTAVTLQKGTDVGAVQKYKVETCA